MLRGKASPSVTRIVLQTDRRNCCRADSVESLVINASLRDQRATGVPISINEIILVYREHAHLYYLKQGKVTWSATHTVKLTCAVADSSLSANEPIPTTKEFKAVEAVYYRFRSTGSLQIALLFPQPAW